MLAMSTHCSMATPRANVKPPGGRRRGRGTEGGSAAGGGAGENVENATMTNNGRRKNVTHAVGCVSVRGRHQPARATSSAASESKDATSAVVQLTSEKEVNELLERCKRDGRKCVVNVSTSSCGPCKFLLPTFEKYAEEHRSTATFAKLVSDQNEELGAVASSWKVLQVPTYRMYDEKGEVSKQFTTGDPKKLGSSLYLFLAYQ